MSDKSAIEWTDATWPLTYGCTKVSPGCAHCYIERTPPYRMAGLRFERGDIPVTLKPERLDWPLRWRKPRRVFVCSLSDLFHDDVPSAFIRLAFGVMARTPQHTYQVLTKRPYRMLREVRAWLSDQDGSESPPGTVRPLPNVWLGVTVENQRFADERIPLLLQTPAAVRFLSCEPLLGPVDLRALGIPTVVDTDGNGNDTWYPDPNRCIDWVIIGGESGPKHRPMDLAWARALRDQCAVAGVPFFMKQIGGYRPGTALDELPADLRVREFPV